MGKETERKRVSEKQVKPLHTNKKIGKDMQYINDDENNVNNQ